MYPNEYANVSNLFSIKTLLAIAGQRLDASHAGK